MGGGLSGGFANTKGGRGMAPASGGVGGGSGVNPTEPVEREIKNDKIVTGDKYKKNAEKLVELEQFAKSQWGVTVVDLKGLDAEGTFTNL